MKVWNEEYNQPERFLRLVDEGNRVQLQIVNSKGDRVFGGSVLSISKGTGKIHLHACICDGAAQKAGLTLDRDRRIMKEDF